MESSPNDFEGWSREALIAYARAAEMTTLTQVARITELESQVKDALASWRREVAKDKS